MKKLLFIFLSTGLLIAYYGCMDDPEMKQGIIGAKEPEFEGSTVRVGKTASSITVRAKISKENGDRITGRGFYYGLNDSPTKENGGIPISDANSGIGEYTLTIEGLKQDTRYYILPYAENSKGTAYGVQLVDSTNIGVAGVITMKPDSIHAASARAGGSIQLEGEGEIRSMGVYLYKKGNITDIDTIDCGTTYPIQPKSGMDFFCYLKLLTPSTWYYVRAFVVNSYGTTVGGLDSLFTLDGKPVIGTTAELVRGFTDVTLESSVTNGGDETVVIAECGFCWSIDAVSTIPTVSHHVVQCSVEKDGRFTGTIEGLVSTEHYFARAYAISDLGITVYGDSILQIQTKKNIPTVSTNAVTNIHIQGGNVDVSGIIVDEGMSPVIACGICWSTTNNTPDKDTDATLPLIAGTDGIFSGQLSRLRGNTRYYVRSYATNSQGTAYGDVMQFTTPAIFTGGLNQFPGAWRYESSMAYFAIGSYLYVLGGDLGASYTNELLRYSIVEDRWSYGRTFPGTPAKWQTGVTYGDGVLVYGGYNGNGDEKPGLYHYRAGQNNDWLYYEGPPDSAIVNRTVGYSYSNSVFFIGGMCEDTVRADVWSFDFPDKSWQKMSDFPEKQYGGIAVVMDDVAYVGMGRDSNDVCNNTIWTTSDDAQTWNFKTYYPVTGNIWGGVVCNRHLYIINGNYRLIAYNPETNEWIQKSQIPETYRTVHCIYSIGNKIYIGFGSNSINSFVIYDPLWDN